MSNLKIRYQSEKIRVPVIQSVHGLLKTLHLSSGRTNTGQLNMFHRGGGLKRRYRFIDFKRVLWNLASLVLYHEYDPNRTSLITLICFYNGILSYILTTEGTSIGDVLFSGTKYMYINYGNFLPIKLIPEGSQLHSLELKPKLGAKFIRSAGTFAILVKKFFSEKLILLRLPSKEEILVNMNCMATMGRVSRHYHMLEVIHKAGWKRLRNFRPKVRGVAKNPVDHPHGGGGGRCLVTFSSKIAKNVSTKNKKRKSFLFIIAKSRKKRKHK
jgi:large subunit ribosomal protein L2